MSEVKMTVQQLLDLGLWDQVCDYKGWNPYCLNEGLVDKSEVVEFDSVFKKEPEKRNSIKDRWNISLEQLEEWLHLLEIDNSNVVIDQIENILDQMY